MTLCKMVAKKSVEKMSNNEVSVNFLFSDVFSAYDNPRQPSNITACS